LRRLVSVLLIGTALAAARPAGAEERCSGGTSTAEDAECLSRALSVADAALNRIYARALATIAADPDSDPKRKKDWADALRSAERAWMAFRDADCGDPLIPDEWHDGSGAGPAMLECRVDLTEARTREIAQRYVSR
jgi:uncharacterized protein YecT (DUF1311 family)